jgi:6-phosphogluconate dehydrogenase
MQIGMIGLGRMGGSMTRRLPRCGCECVVYSADVDQIGPMVKEGAVGSTELSAFVEKLRRPRVARVMVPAGEPTEQVIRDLGALMEPGE